MISFVIPAYNEEYLLPRTLQSIHDSVRDARAAGASIDDYEIIVANDASTDKTRDVAIAGRARVVDVAHRHIAKVRNSGAKDARGELLIFVDADTTVTPAAVRGALKALARGAIGGAARASFSDPIGVPARVASWIFFRGIYTLGMATGVFVFCTREAFAAVKGFPEEVYTAEDCFFVKSLRKHGKFTLLRQTVYTSGRKMRAYTPLQLIKTFGRVVIGGKRVMQSREGLEFWYNPPREAPPLDVNPPVPLDDGDELDDQLGERVAPPPARAV